MQILKNYLRKFEVLMMAITFAEAGEKEIALQIMRDEEKKQKQTTQRVRAVNQLDNRAELTL